MKYIVLFFAVVCTLSCKKTPSTSGYIYTIAGNGKLGDNGDGGSAISAEIDEPLSVAVDGSGSIYLPDIHNSKIKKISPQGIIATFAGNGTAGFSGDGGAAVSAQLSGPGGVTVDGDGNVYIIDGATRIRKINTAGIINTIAGNGTLGYSGDGGSALDATLNCPSGLAVDKNGNLYIADGANNVIRKIDVSGIITTVAGNGFGAGIDTGGYSGDGGPAISAKLWYPYGVAVDGSGNIFIADNFNNVVRKVNTSGIISTYAGNGTYGFVGDGGSALSAQLNNVYAVSADNAGNVYISDAFNQRIRKVSTSQVISTIAGNGYVAPNGLPYSGGFTGDGGLATLAELSFPAGTAIDRNSNLYIADAYNNRIRKVNH